MKKRKNPIDRLCEEQINVLVMLKGEGKSDAIRRAYELETDIAISILTVLRGIEFAAFFFLGVVVVKLLT